MKMASLEKKINLHQAEMSFYPFPEENSYTYSRYEKTYRVSSNLQPELLKLKFNSFKMLQRP